MRLRVRDMDGEFYNQGLAKAGQGDYQGAIKDFDRALQLNPHLAEAYYQRGLAYFDLGQVYQAVSDYTQALKLNPNQIGSYYGRALVRVSLKNFPGAIEDVKEVIRINAYYAPAHHLLGTIYGKMGDKREAIANWKKAAKLYLAVKDADSCRNLLEQIQQLQSPPKPPATAQQQNETLTKKQQEFYSQVLERAEKGDCLGVIEDLNWVLKADFFDSQAYCCRGVLRAKMGDNTGAMADFNQALRLNPSDVIAYRNRGKIRHQMGDYGGAMADFNQGLEMEPEDGGLYLARGNAYREMGNYYGAISDCDRAIEINPHNAWSYYYRAQARACLQEMQQAIDDYQLAATKFGDREDWTNYRKALDSLKKIQSAFPKLKTANSLPKSNNKSHGSPIFFVVRKIGLLALLGCCPWAAPK